MKRIYELITSEKTIVQFIFVELLFLIIIPFSTSCSELSVFPYLIIGVVCLAIYAMYLLYKIFLLFNQRAYEEQQREMIVRQKELQNQYILAQMQSSKDMEHLKSKLLEKTQAFDLSSKNELRNAIDELLLQYGDVLTLNYSKNKVIDVILYHKVLLMKKMHITHAIDVQVHEDLSLSNYELMSVLNNMLDNAIEACALLEVKKRYIELSIKIVSNYLVVKVINSIKDSNVSLIPGISSKSDKKHHGIGLMVLEHTCKANQGSFQYEIDSVNKRITCVSTLLLKSEA